MMSYLFSITFKYRFLIRNKADDNQYSIPKYAIEVKEEAVHSFKKDVSTPVKQIEKHNGMCNSVVCMERAISFKSANWYSYFIMFYTIRKNDFDERLDCIKNVIETSFLLSLFINSCEPDSFMSAKDADYLIMENVIFNTKSLTLYVNSQIHMDAVHGIYSIMLTFRFIPLHQCLSSTNHITCYS